MRSLRLCLVVLIASLMAVGPSQAYKPAMGKFPDPRLKLNLDGKPWNGLNNMATLPGPPDKRLLSAAFISDEFAAIDAKDILPQERLKAKIEVILRQYVYQATTAGYLAIMKGGLLRKDVYDTYQVQYAAYSESRASILERFTSVLVPLIDDYARTLTKSEGITVRTDYNRIKEDPKNVGSTTLVFEVLPVGVNARISEMTSYVTTYALDQQQLEDMTWTVGSTTVTLPVPRAIKKRMFVYKETYQMSAPSPAFDTGKPNAGVWKFPPDGEPGRLVCRSWARALNRPDYSRWEIIFAELAGIAINRSIGYQHPRASLSVQVDIAYVPKDFENDRDSILRLCNPVPFVHDAGGHYIDVPIREAHACTCGMLPSSGSSKTAYTKTCEFEQCRAYCEKNGFDYYTHVGHLVPC